MSDLTPETKRALARDWQRWFAWRPVRINGHWHWLSYVGRNQYANKPARYHYTEYPLRTPDPLVMTLPGGTKLRHRKGGWQIVQWGDDPYE